MIRVGGIGHRSLPLDTVKALEADLSRRILELSPGGVTGVCCLADGADQLFARILLEVGGQLEVIVPAVEYRDGLPEHAREEFDRLIEKAQRVQRLGHQKSTAEAHLAAGRLIVDRVDRVLAVWDGKPARGLGGTADIVKYAQLLGVPVDVIWPRGATRD
jgi:hypothetical protein